MRTLLALLTLLLCAPAWARPTAWSSPGAHTLEEGRAEVGLWQPMRLGLTDEIELEVFPIWMFLAPHAALKLGILDGDCWTVASRHQISYPTPLLSTLSREGTGGVLPADTVVPHIVTMAHQALWTFVGQGHHALTLRAGLRVGSALGDSTLTTIDLPVIYPRMAAMHEGVVFEGGVDLTGPLWGPLSYAVDGDVFLIPDDGGWALEHALLLVWRPSARWSVELGYKAVYGAYPFGTDVHLLPLVDVSYAFSLWEG